MKQILFNTEMVQGIMAGTKTVTRRLIRPQPPKDAQLSMGANMDVCHAFDGALDHRPNDRRVYMAPYKPGDILYVRETWAKCQNAESYVYKADFNGYAAEVFYPSIKWHPSIHMPKEAARIFLRVTDVRVERLKDIDGEGAEAEGVIEINNPLIREDKATYDAYARRLFAITWENTVEKDKQGLYGWNANPWVWVIEFERIGRINPILGERAGTAR